MVKTSIRERSEDSKGPVWRARVDLRTGQITVDPVTLVKEVLDNRNIEIHKERFANILDEYWPDYQVDENP